ncbi:MAG: DUF2249 domain-containing protein [Streptosporangiaceae bacterium]
MSSDSTISTTSLTALSRDSPAGSVRASSPNEAAIDAIRAHHAQLAEQLHVHTNAVVTAARTGECGRERDALHDWYRTELMPHVVAEEHALYSPVSQLDAARLLISGMLAEHRFLVSLIADLALASDPFQVATTAVAAQAVFTVHLSKENDLLLPALDQAGLNLPTILDGMHEILGHPHNDAEHDGCGCGCDHDAGDAQDAPLQISTRPEELQMSTQPEEADGDLDVRALPHGQRHEIIFARLDQLQPGQALVIVNDHDPKPLRYQTAAMWPDRFVWSYLQAGPQIWRVAISRAG